MTYKLLFAVHALAEWKKLGHTVREEFKKALTSGWKIHLFPPLVCMVIKIVIKLNRASGYRLVYQVKDDAIVVLVLSVTKRERNAV